MTNIIDTCTEFREVIDINGEVHLLKDTDKTVDTIIEDMDDDSSDDVEDEE
jgi:hypothetical protein